MKSNIRCWWSLNVWFCLWATWYASLGTFLSLSVIYFTESAQVIVVMGLLLLLAAVSSKIQGIRRGNSQQWPHQVHQMFFISLWENKNCKDMDDREDGGDERVDGVWLDSSKICSPSCCVSSCSCTFSTVESCMYNQQIKKKHIFTD